MSMLNDFTIIFLICHFIADFQLQSEVMSKEKVNSNKIRLQHVAIHAFTIIIAIAISIVNHNLINSLYIS